MAQGLLCHCIKTYAALEGIYLVMVRLGSRLGVAIAMKVMDLAFNRIPDTNLLAA